MAYWCYGMMLDEEEDKVYLAEIYWQKKGRGKQALFGVPVEPSQVVEDSKTVLDDLKSAVEAGLFFRRKEKGDFGLEKVKLKGGKK